MQNLRTLRRSRSLTFLDLAALTGISARQIAEIEYGLRRLSSSERDSLALVLGLAPAGFTGAHRRPLTQTVVSAPFVDRRALQALMAAALAATIATGSMVGGAPALRLPVQLAPAALEHAAPQPSADPVGATGALGKLTFAPAAAAQAAALLALTQSILELRAALPKLAISPSLLVGATPPESVAPPLPVIERATAFVLSEAGPLGCPVKPTAGQVVLTQGYGVGSHAPAETWGAVDLAVDGDGDGYADSAATWYTPVVATHDGHVTVNLDSWPAGNHVWVNEPGGIWRSGYAHLAVVLVASGQFVRAGEQIGLIGSSGESSGPHLHYHVWRGDLNLDPTELVGC